MSRPLPLLRIAWRNVRKNWRHSLGSVLSIVVGFVAIGLFEGYLSDLEDLQAHWYSQRSMLGDLLIEKRGASSQEALDDPWRFALQPREQAFIDGYLAAQAGDVVVRVRVLQLSGLASTGRAGISFVSWAYDVEEAARIRGPWAWHATAGRPLQRAHAHSAMVGHGLSGLLDCVASPPEAAQGPGGYPVPEERPLECRNARLQLTATTESGQLNLIDPDIVGTFDAGLKEMDDRFVHLPLPLAQRLLDTEAVTFYSVALARPESAPAFGAALTEAARAEGLDIEALSWREHLYGDMYRRTTTLLGLYRTFVVLIVVTIAGMSVFTTMLKAVNERVREIGTLRSLGYRRQHVVRLFTLEAGLLALVASAVGLVVLSASVVLINAAGITYKGGVASQAIPLSVSLLPSAVLFATLFLSGIAVLAALLPARRAARLRIAEALGHAA
jgi:putative ABC transport system permease protein